MILSVTETRYTCIFENVQDYIGLILLFSHAHMDHIGGLMQHVMKRSLYGMAPATYFMPGFLVEKVKAIAGLFQDMHETDGAGVLTDKLDITPIKPGDNMKV